jgi:hypothetical protein
MRYILSILITLFAVQAIAQPTPTYTGSYTQMSYNRGSVGALRLQYIPRGFYPFPTFDTLGTIWIDSAQTRGLFYHNGALRLRLASVPYVDSIAASIEAGSVDSSIYSTVTRLSDSLHSLRDYVDSNNTIIYGSIARIDSTDSVFYYQIAELQSDVPLIDSALGVAFGAISNLYDTKADKDTLTNFLLKSDTATLSNRINLKQNYSDTTTWDATRYWVSTQIPSLAAYVPYTGATTDVNLGTHNILPNSVRLSTTPTGTLTNVGQLYWDATNVTPAIPLNANVTLQIGQEEHIRARNNTGVQINDGQVVYINDAQGNNPTIALANADSVTTSEVVGIATENIAHNGTGFVTTFGVVNGINTSGYNDGDILYLSATNGTITNVIPSPPHNVVKVGIALNSTNNGKIFVHPAEPIGQDTTFAAPYNSNKVAPTQRAIGTYVRNIVKDTASALRTAINGKYGTSDTGRAATNIVTGGALNKVRDSLAALSGGGSSTIVKANEFNMLYKANGDTTIRGTTKVRVDTTDLRMEFAFDTTTSTVTTDPHGGVKMWGTNRMGMGAVRINDTVSIPAALQRAINTQITSTMLPTVTGNIAYTNNYVYTGMVQPAGTLGYIAAAWNSTIQHFNYNKTTFTTASGANSSSLIRIGSISQSAGIICGNTKFSGGGGRGTFTFSFPTYLSTQRIMIGYSEAVAALTGDPSTFLTTPTPYSSLMVIKDAADTTLQFAHYSGTGVVTKVNTGIKPNNEDVYRLTVYIAPNSTYYMQLEVISKTAAIRVVTLNPTTNVPPVGDRLVQQQAVNNGTVGGVVVYGLIQHLEEIY